MASVKTWARPSCGRGAFGIYDSLRPRRVALRRGKCTRPRSEALEGRTLLSVDFTQGANGDANNSPPLGDVTWINGILIPNNSEYFEGVSTLQRVFLDAIPATGTNQHTLLFSHQAVKGTARAYDFLTSWDQALAATNQIAPGTLVDPHTDGPDANTIIEAYEPGSASPAGFTTDVQALHATGSIVNVSVPDNMDGPDAGTAEDLILDGASVNARIAAYEGFFGNRTVRIYANAAITASSMTFQGYTGSGPLANYALNWTSTASRVLIEFGAHLAQGQDFTLAGVGYGAGKGAGSISGGPYHVQLSTLDGASLGSQDNQIQANAVSAPPSFTIDKTGDALSKVGDPAQYTITINNNGAMPLFAQSINDTLKGAITASQFTETGGTDNDILDVGETWTYTYSVVVAAGAPDPLVNTVTAVFDTQAGLTGIELTHSDSHSVNLFQPSITIDKAANDTLAAVGDTVQYTFTVTNTSSADSPDLDLTSVVDTLLGSLTGLFPDKLASGTSASATVSRVVQAGDTDPLPNTVSVVSYPVGFPNAISASDSESVNLFQPSITIDKTGDALSKVGDPVNYTIVVTNTSSADSPNLVGTVTDPLLGISQAINLAPGASTTINATRNVQAGDPDPLVNTATVTATPVGSVNSVNASDSHTVNLFQPGITITKVANDKLAAVGDPITYTFTVTNTSSADSPALDLTSVVDTLLGNLTASFPDTLAPGASASASVTRVVQAGDPDPLPNTVTVHSNPLGFPNDIFAAASESVNLFQPSITIDKTGDALSKVGDPVNYTIVVTNTSSADSPNLVGTLSDPLLGISEPINLAPGQSAAFTPSRTVQAGDPDPLVNTATVTATPVGSVNSVSASDGHTVNLFQPSITLDKSVDDSLAAVGDTVNYTIVVTNTSSADSPNLVGTVSDPLLGINQAVNLAPGGSTTITRAYLITSADPDPLNNTATVTVSPTGFPNVLTASDSESVNLFQPSISIAKSGDTLSKVGDTADYVITVTNTSSADSPNLVGTVSDPLLGISQAINLAPGGTATINASLVVPAGSPDPLVNTATVTATPVGSVNSVSATDGHSINLFQPDFIITKVSLDGDGLVTVGDTVTYEITLTNTGSADSPPLNPLSILDTKIGALAPSAFAESGANNDQLDVGETWTGQFTYVVVAADLPSFTNVVTATFQVADVPSAGFNGRNQLTRSASETLQVQNPPRGSVLPTGVDCDQFVDVVLNKTATLDSLIGQLADGFNLSVSTGPGAKITNVSDPGAAFYFTTFTAQADAGSGAITVKIQETSTGGSQYLMALTQVSVYQVVGTTGDLHCTTLIANSSYSVLSDGIQFSLPDSLEGLPLVCRIRIDPKSIVGRPAPAGDLTNNFKTFVDGVFADEDPDGVLLNVPPYATSVTFSATQIKLSQRLTLKREATALLA